VLAGCSRLLFQHINCGKFQFKFAFCQPAFVPCCWLTDSEPKEPKKAGMRNRRPLCHGTQEGIFYVSFFFSSGGGPTREPQSPEVPILQTTFGCGAAWLPSFLPSFLGNFRVLFPAVFRLFAYTRRVQNRANNNKKSKGRRTGTETQL